MKWGYSAAFLRFSNSVAYYGLAMDLQKFGLSIYLVQALFGIIDIPAMLVATTTMIYVGRRATVSSFLVLAGLMVIANMFVPEGELSLPPCSSHIDTRHRVPDVVGGPPEVTSNTLIILALGRLRQEKHQFLASLDYRQRPCLKRDKRKLKLPCQ